MLQTVVRVAVFFAFIAAGAVLTRLKRLSREGVDGLSAYVYWLGFPAWLIVTFTQLPRPPATVAVPLIAYVGAMITAAVIAAGAAFLLKAKRDEAMAAGAGALVNNSAFLGVPVALSLFGTEAAHLGPIVVAADFLVCFTLACAVLSLASGHGLTAALKRTAQNPTVLAAALGVILMFAGLRFPPAAEGALDLLGKSGAPVALVALGGLLGLMPDRALISFDVPRAVAVTAKLLLAPALVAGVLFLVHADPALWRICVFMSACPTAVSIFIQARVYNVWSEGAAAAVAQGTLISLVTLSALAIALQA